MGKVDTTARKDTIVKFFFKRISRETYSFWGMEL